MTNLSLRACLKTCPVGAPGLQRSTTLTNSCRPRALTRRRVRVFKQALRNTRSSREQIRAARLAPLVSLLQQRGLQLVVREAANFTLPAYPGLLVKDSYWRWPARNLAGNAIDFHVQVLGLSFHEAMRQITGT